ncbi:MAG: hypothetical protein OK455_04360 [Thaumarchaeota archaeon]|nr:hypothetical protein [Nitrososphaerota archaeon]
MRARRSIAVVILVVVFLAGIGYVLTNDLASSSAASSRSAGGNLLTNGGFESGNLQGWQTSNLLPTVESTIVNGSTYAAMFETTSNGLTLSQCTMHALKCQLLNSSTISQAVSGVSISPSTRLSIALYSSFQSPSLFQVTLDLSPSSQHSHEVIIYYIFYASSEQCDTYSQLLVNASQFARAFCLSAQQGEWNAITRNISNDIPSSLSTSDLSGSSLTLSLSFSGGNSTDTTYVDSVYLG